MLFCNRPNYVFAGIKVACGSCEGCITAIKNRQFSDCKINQASSELLLDTLKEIRQCTIGEPRIIDSPIKNEIDTQFRIEDVTLVDLRCLPMNGRAIELNRFALIYIHRNNKTVLRETVEWIA